MTIVMVIHFLHKAALYFSTPAGNRRLLNWQHACSHEQKEGSEHQRKSKGDTANRKWGEKKADVCQEFCLINSTIQKIWKNRTQIINVFEWNR